MPEKREDTPAMNEMDALRQDMKKLRSDFEGILKSIGGKGDKSNDDGISTDIGEAVGRLRHRLDALQSQIKEKGERSVANMEQHIQDRPFQSATIAFVVGVILGYILDRRMHH